MVILIVTYEVIILLYEEVHEWRAVGMLKLM